MDDLSRRMDFGHVIRVMDDGTVSDDVSEQIRFSAPESVDVGCDDEGQISREDDAAMVAQVAASGWTILDGWSGQYNYSGPIMHSAEQIGGALAAHILETPGYWVSVTVDTEDGDSAGWALLYREAAE